MILGNHHTHSTFCDGSVSPRDMAQAAMDQGLAVLGFSAHGPLPFETGWTMEAARMGEYCGEIRSLQQEFSGRLEILLGFEMDWIPGIRVPGDEFWQGVDRDYAIGSVHFLKSPDGRLYTIDDTAANVGSVRDIWYPKDASPMARDYYRELRALIAHGGFDILGHFDLVRKNNRELGLYDPEADWYRKEVQETLEVLAWNPVVVEVNTGGMARGRTDSPYPELWMLSRMRELGIQVMINADAHAPEHLLAHRQAALDLVEAAGYREIQVLTRQGWVSQALD